MILRFSGASQGLTIAILLASTLAFGIARAAGPGPGYTYLGVSYERTDVKYGVNPSGDDRFNNGRLEGYNVDASLGILSWLHAAGQYFDGECIPCGTDANGVGFDQDFQGYKIGLGVNIGFDRIGLSDRADFVLRSYYLDVEHSDLNPGSPSSLSDSGWSVEGVIRSQISPRTELEIGYAYQDVGTVSNTDLMVGINFRVGAGFALLGKAIVFDSDTGLELGVRWYFGDLLLDGRDSIVR